MTGSDSNNGVGSSRGGSGSRLGSGGGGMSQATTARKNFELSNDVEAVDPSHAIFNYSLEEEKKLQEAAPWKSE